MAKRRIKRKVTAKKAVSRRRPAKRRARKCKKSLLASLF